MSATAAVLATTLNTSKIAWGIAAIIAGFGSRFLIGELTPAQQGVLRSPVVKRVVLFCMLYLPTRDVLLAACLTVAVSALIEHLLNEGSPYCVLPECLKQRQDAAASGSASPYGSTAPPPPGRGDATVGRPGHGQPLPIGLGVPMTSPSAAARKYLVAPRRVQESDPSDDLVNNLF